MQGGNLVINVIIILIVGVILFTLVIKKLWSYLVVRLFPGAVDQNLIVTEIPWQIALIFAIIFIILAQNS